MININNFVFKFERILKYKSTIEDNAVSNYNYYKKKLEDNETQLSIMKKHNLNIMKEKNENSKNTNIINMKIYSEYLKSNSKRMDIQISKVANSKEEANDARENMIEASKEKKVYENLKKRHKEIFLTELKREEDKMLDQIVSYNSSSNIGG